MANFFFFVRIHDLYCTARRRISSVSYLGFGARDPAFLLDSLYTYTSMLFNSFVPICLNHFWQSYFIVSSLLSPVVLILLLFCLPLIHFFPLGAVSKPHSFSQFYADDPQIYFPDLLSSVQICMSNSLSEKFPLDV